MAQVSNQQRAEAALRTLGKLSAEGIAALFLKLGIKGKRNKCEACPVYNYMKRRGVRRHTVYGSSTRLPGGIFLTNPTEVSVFIRSFDVDREYSSLCAA